jgi:hypothetical protein
MQTEQTVLWLLGLLMGLQIIIVLLGLYVYRFLDKSVRLAWPFLIAAWSLIIIRRIMGTVRWSYIYNLVVYENILLVVISLLNLMFILTLLGNSKHKDKSDG